MFRPVVRQCRIKIYKTIFEAQWQPTYDSVFETKLYIMETWKDFIEWNFFGTTLFQNPQSPTYSAPRKPLSLPSIPWIALSTCIPPIFTFLQTFTCTHFRMSTTSGRHIFTLCAPNLHLLEKPLRSCNLIKPLFAPSLLIANPFATDDHRVNMASPIITMEINRVINLINYEYLLLRCGVCWQGTFNDGHEIVT